MYTINQIGERTDFIVRSGATLGPVQLTITQDDGTPADLTGATIVANLYKMADNSIVAALTVSCPTPTNGELTWSLNSTGSLSTQSLDSDPLYYFGVSVIWSTGVNESMQYGAVSFIQGTGE